MKPAIFKKTLAFVFMVTLVMGMAMSADAQRRGHMRGRQQDPSVQQNWSGYGPGMMGSPGMMGPGYGMSDGPAMMGPGYGMMGGHGMMGFGMGMGHGMSPAMGMMGPYMAGCFYRLDLTEDQQNKMLSMQKQARRERMETMLDIMDIRDDLIQAMAADRPDPGKVRKLREAMSQKQAEMLETSIENRNRIYDMLTKEQREQLSQFNRRPSYRPYGSEQDR
ncbi:MAG: Spy/CpxP family protein refolding chaperone [Desulfobacterales bacterium]|nr:Spy/CpxP family protein refolding chaperone [Desulfobacterales bacterium]